jgi:putative transposase
MLTERRAYSSDLTDAEWQILEPLLPLEKPGGRHRKSTMREIINAIQYILRGGCAWQLMPHDLPHWRAAYEYFRQWRNDGTWLRLHDHLHAQLRTQMQRNMQPSAALLDSQLVKTTEKGGRTAMTGQKRSAAESDIYWLIQRVL